MTEPDREPSPGMSLPSKPRSVAAMTSAWYSWMTVTTSKDQLVSCRVLYLKYHILSHWVSHPLRDPVWPPHGLLIRCWSDQTWIPDQVQTTEDWPLCNIPQSHHSFSSFRHDVTLSDIFLLFYVLKNKCTCAQGSIERLQLDKNVHICGSEIDVFCSLCLDSLFVEISLY